MKLGKRHQRHIIREMDRYMQSGRLYDHIRYILDMACPGEVAKILNAGEPNLFIGYFKSEGDYYSSMDVIIPRILIEARSPRKKK